MPRLNKDENDENCENSSEDRSHNEELADLSTYNEKLTKIVSEGFSSEPEEETLSGNGSGTLYSFYDLSKNKLLQFLKEHQNYEFELRDLRTGEYVWINEVG